VRTKIAVVLVALTIAGFLSIIAFGEKGGPWDSMQNIDASRLKPGSTLPALDAGALTNVPSSGGGGSGSGFPLTNTADYASFGQSNVLFSAYTTNAAALGTAAGTYIEYVMQDAATSEWRKYKVMNIAGTTTTNFSRLD